MGPSDVPKPVESVQAAEVEQSKSGDESRQTLQAEIDRLRNQLGRGDARSDGPDPNPEVKNHGQIAEMTLPKGWVGGAPYKFSGGIGTRSFREVHPADAPNAMLCFYYRGLPISADGGKAFHDLLQKPPHALTEDELKSLSEVLRDKARPEDFKVSSVRTQDWNGRRVLVVEGRYPGIQEDTTEIFVDASGDGRAVQEIYYQAPTDVYAKYATAAKDSMKSIDWK